MTDRYSSTVENSPSGTYLCGAQIYVMQIHNSTSYFRSKMGSKRKKKEAGTNSKNKLKNKFCSLCQEHSKYGIKNKFGCCRRCRTVKVKVKNIKPMIPEIKSMLNAYKRLKKSDVRYHKEEKVVTDVQIEGTY